MNYSTCMNKRPDVSQQREWEFQCWTYVKWDENEWIYNNNNSLASRPTANNQHVCVLTERGKKKIHISRQQYLAAFHVWIKIIIMICIWPTRSKTETVRIIEAECWGVAITRWKRVAGFSLSPSYMHMLQLNHDYWYIRFLRHTSNVS